MNLFVGVVLLLAQISIIKTLDLQESRTDDLINAITANNYSTFSTLFNKIDINDPTQFREVIREVLKEEFNNINLDKLVKFFKIHENKKQSLFGYSAVFDELKTRGKTNETVLVTLAFGLKNLLTDDSSFEANAEAIRLKDSLPESVRNLAFANQVCIKNVDYNEYMYAAVDAFNYDSERRRVFTWIPGGGVTQGTWIIEPFKDVYHIKNAAHDEYLYSPNWWYNWEDYVRRLFTWIPGGTDGDNEKFEWLFVPYEDDVLIKNVYYAEYLSDDIVSKADAGSKKNGKWDDERRQVFSWLTKEAYFNSIWKIEAC